MQMVSITTTAAAAAAAAAATTTTTTLQSVIDALDSKGNLE
jgi:hypothetical protein